ncbi:transposase [Streptococcus sp. 2018037]|uniref:transposase n=1 Tax=Streptococcus sp. 2018037 TaxID=2870782 RepID=UPI00155ED865|nr:transposase [Streptococcus suis]MBY0753801.1 transposase [Streptococcus sp. 2018037]
MINPMHLWFDGFKVHVLAALSGYILYCVTTPASVNDFKEVAALLERCQQSVIVAVLLTPLYFK